LTPLAAAAVLLLVGACARERRADPSVLITTCETLRVLPDAQDSLPAPSPVFTWDPACPAVGLTVYRAGDAIWALGSPAGLRPPVRYGLAPAGAVSQAGPVPLERGVTYAVRLEYLEARYEGREDLILAPAVEFVP
jgi:hypothetical protein